MVVNEVDLKRALKTVSDSFKIPWLYRIEALFKGKDVFASPPTGYGSDLKAQHRSLPMSDGLLFSSICPHLKCSRAATLQAEPFFCLLDFGVLEKGSA